MGDEPQPDKPGLLHRVLTVPNLASVGAGLIIFWVLTDVWTSATGTLLAALIGALITAAVWLGWTQLALGPRLERVVSAPVLGYVPTTPGRPTPVLGDTTSDGSLSYLKIAEALEARNQGQVIMICSSTPGLGATTVAMNLAAAATRMGRRVVLVDADPSGGLSDYGRAGNGPGWTDLAAGTASLREASRLWRIDESNTFPVIPVGTTVENRGEVLGSMVLAATVDELTEHADLLILNSAPVNWDTSLQQVATHADGTLLVVTPEVDPRSLSEIGQRLEEIGAPVVGYVVNRADRTRDRSPRWRRSIKRMAATFVILLAVFSTWNAYRIWDSWRSVERHSFDEVAISELPAVPSPDQTGENLSSEAVTAVTAVPSDSGTYQTFMIVGSDIGDHRADVIVLTMLPSDGTAPIMVSLPRDLYLPNRCTQGYTRLNANFNGCGDNINGATLLATAVEDFTGVQVDHFALFTFSGFEQIIDEVGGIQICVDYAVRDTKSDLDLPAGCTVASGAQALAWVRSRHTLEYVNGRWQTMPGVSDLTRNERQQDVILAMFKKAGKFDSPQQLARVVRSVSDAFTLDDQLGISDAIGLAWDLRKLDPSDFVRLTIPVQNYETSTGAQVLLPTVPFDELLSDYYAASASGDAAE